MSWAAARKWSQSCGVPDVLHIVLHFVVPLVVAILFHRDRWKQAWLILVATMVVDLDHLLATPIYDPLRCSIGFHPMHTWPLILAYVAAFVLPWIWKAGDPRRKTVRLIHLVGLGLLIHMALDAVDCLV